MRLAGVSVTMGEGQDAPSKVSCALPVVAGPAISISWVVVRSVPTNVKSPGERFADRDIPADHGTPSSMTVVLLEGVPVASVY